MVNEKFFLFIWFWLLILFSMGLMNLFVWIYRAFSQGNAEEFVITKLVSSILLFIFLPKFKIFQRFATPNMPKKRELELFVQRGLCLDGVTVLRLIDMNCDQTVTSLLVYQLLKRYREGRLNHIWGKIQKQYFNYKKSEFFPENTKNQNSFRKTQKIRILSGKHK